ncbi:MAG: transcription elongation factor GreA [Actinomycetia bacterium]|nr:transcription elongation factor GreA [Actinomycetes bacterium]
MSDKELLVSAEGLKKLEAELEHLKTVKRTEVAERIKQAREFGDISENSEYEDAKNEQGLIEARIQSLENMLRNARVVDAASQDPTVVHIGSRVRVLDENEAVEEEYVVVGSAEADPIHNRISIESPVGKALLGAAVGQTVEVMAPVGRIRLKVLAIQQD